MVWVDFVFVRCLGLVVYLVDDLGVGFDYFGCFDFFDLILGLVFDGFGCLVGFADWWVCLV